MNAWVAREAGEEEESLITVIESARSRVGNPEMTYELAVYAVNREKFEEKAAADESYTRNTLQGYSKSKAAKDDALTRIGSAVAVTDKHTGGHISLDIQWISEQKKEENAP